MSTMGASRACWPRSQRESTSSVSVNISVYFDKFIRAEYQQAVEIYLSNIRTQEGNKAQTESTRRQTISKHGGLALLSKPDLETISAFHLIKWRCHIKLIWNPRTRSSDR